MAKNHRTQNRPKQQTPSVSPTYAYTLDEGGASTLYSPQTSMYDLDEDDICPVCESECTCANRSPNANPNNTSPLHGSHNGSATAAARGPTEGPAQSHSAGHPSLKIKLTLKPPLQNKARASVPGASSKSSAVRLPKKKAKIHAETMYAGGSGDGDASGIAGSPFSAFGHPLVPGAQLNANGSLPKKRGRPTKAVVAAREAAVVGGLVASGSRAAGGAIDPISQNVTSARQVKYPSTRAAPVPKSGATKKKGKRLSGAAGTSRAISQQRKPVKKIATVEDYTESSELSELDEDEETNIPHSIEYPTFIPAFSTSSYSSSSSSSSPDSSSNSDSDSDAQYSSARDEAAKLRKELMGDNEPSQRRKWGHRNNWEIRSRKSSVGAEGTSDVAMEGDSDEDTEEEANGEGEDEADGEADVDEHDEDVQGPGEKRLMRYAGVATGWTDDDEESSFDAELFFANLSDSSADASDDDQMGDVEVGFGEEDGPEEGTEMMEFSLSGSGFDAMSLSEVAAAGFMAPFSDLERTGVENLPFTHGWDTHHLLSNALKDESMLNFDVTQGLRDVPLSRSETFVPGLEEADIMMATSEEEEAVAMFDNDSSQDPEEEDGVEIFDDSDDGDTTEDEYVDVDGIAMPRNLVLLRFPESLGAIDPMSTVSSPVRGRPLSANPLPKSGQRTPSKPNPKPAEILARKASLSHDKDSKEDDGNSSTKDSSGEASNVPTMGSFAPEVTDKTKRVVITNPGNTASGDVPPSPFPAIRRLRRRSESSSKLSRCASDRGSGGSRHSSLLSSIRSPYQALVSGDFDSADAVNLPPAEPICIDDVLDTAFLEAESSTIEAVESAASDNGDGESDADADADAHRHLQNLARWDRIPMDTFRKTRSGAEPDLAIANKMVVGVGPARRAPRPADGFSYGSAVGGMLRGGPLNTALWDLDTRVSKAEGKQKDPRAINTRKKSVIISPVILPVRDGDRTPTNDRHQQHAYLGYTGHTSRAHAHAQNVKSRKELRREKKRNRTKFFGASTAGLRHNHFPNAKSRSSSGMQRSNFFGSSSVPPLSI